MLSSKGCSNCGDLDLFFANDGESYHSASPKYAVKCWVCSLVVTYNRVEGLTARETWNQNGREKEADKES